MVDRVPSKQEVGVWITADVLICALSILKQIHLENAKNF